MGITATHPRVTVARAVAEELLRELPDRWAHSMGVAQRAADLGVTVDPAERELLVAAAWLHDIGYGQTPHATGFHPLDGANYLRQHGWPERICALVAHHSGAVFLARPQYLDGALNQYLREESPVSDALTYADQTTGPLGQPMTIEQRIAGMLARRGPGSIQARVHHLREPYLRAVAKRVEQRLATIHVESASYV